MDTITMESLSQLANTMSLSAFLLYAWYQERKERMSAVERLVSHLEADEQKNQESEQ